MCSARALNGLVVFNKDGKFVSFFGANEPVTLRMILQRLFFTQTQKEQLSASSHLAGQPGVDDPVWSDVTWPHG